MCVARRPWNLECERARVTELEHEVLRPGRDVLAESLDLSPVQELPGLDSIGAGQETLDSERAVGRAVSEGRADTLLLLGNDAQVRFCRRTIRERDRSGDRRTNRRKR